MRIAHDLTSLQFASNQFHNYEVNDENTLAYILQNLTSADAGIYLQG